MENREIHLVLNSTELDHLRDFIKCSLKTIDLYKRSNEDGIRLKLLHIQLMEKLDKQLTDQYNRVQFEVGYSI